ncbi:hypothetical protein Tco_1438244 [Tanacetum coccineum]
MEDDVEISVLTKEQYIALIPDDIKPGIVNPKIGDDVKFEINSNFMRELRCKLFAGTDDEDAYEHVRTVLEIVDLFNFPSVTHNAIMLRDETTTRIRINDVLDNVDAIYESVKGEHPTKEHPLKKEDEAIKHRSGYHQKDRKPSQNDKTEHGMEKTVQNPRPKSKKCQSQSQYRRISSQTGAGTEEYYWMNLNPSDGPGKPNSIIKKL